MVHQVNKNNNKPKKKTKTKKKLEYDEKQNFQEYKAITGMNATPHTWIANEFYGATKISYAVGNKIKLGVLGTVIFHATLKITTAQITIQS